MAPDPVFPAAPPRISVIGAGVVGLSCAVRLAEAGYPVDVLARDLPLETTSAVAGGHWGPFMSQPPDDVERWSRRSFAEMEAISTVPGAGIAMRTGYFLGSHPPEWAAGLADVMPLTRVGSQAPGTAGGWRAVVPMANMPVYLTYLVRRLRAADGTLTRLPLSALPARGLVVNCTGLAARSLVSDPAVRPMRGQVVVTSNPGLTDWIVDSDRDIQDPAASTYVFPHPDRVVIGGTVQPDEWSTEPDPATGQAILERAIALVPRLSSARVLAHRVGLRPARPLVRLETVTTPESSVVHCYGHGGSGITLSWGCADDVLAAVAAVTHGVRVA